MFSKTMPVSVSRRLLEEYNKEFNNNNNSNNSNNNNSNNNSNQEEQSFSSSPMSYSSSRSISPEPTFDSIVSGHSLHRQPTFSYIPIHKRRPSALMFSRSMSFNSLSMSIPNQQSSISSSSSIQTPESEMPTTPTSLCSSTSDQSVEYTSFPNLEKFADECWTEIRIEKRDNVCDMEMESYDEMLVAGVRFQYF
jgi:hypothetical protein